MRTPSRHKQIINLVLLNTTWTFRVQWAIENKLVKLPDNVDMRLADHGSINDMFISGAADIGSVSIPAFLKAWSRNRDWKIAYPYGKVHEGVFSHKDSGIRSLRDLKGKTIAVRGLDFTATMMLLDILKKKCDISHDEITLVPKLPSSIPALVDKREVDAGLLSQASLADIKKMNLKPISDLNEECAQLYGAPMIVMVLAVKKDIDGNALKRIAASLNAANKIALERLDDVVKSYYEKHGKNESVHFKLMKDLKFRPIESWDENKKKILRREFEMAGEQGLVEKIPRLKNIIMST
ncbi:MAG: MqnA/MqnD/SBP family protein [bacterium]